MLWIYSRVLTLLFRFAVDDVTIIQNTIPKTDLESNSGKSLSYHTAFSPISWARHNLVFFFCYFCVDICEKSADLCRMIFESIAMKCKTLNKKELLFKNFFYLLFYYGLKCKSMYNHLFGKPKSRSYKGSFIKNLTTFKHFMVCNTMQQPSI